MNLRGKTDKKPEKTNPRENAATKQNKTVEFINAFHSELSVPLQAWLTQLEEAVRKGTLKPDARYAGGLKNQMGQFKAMGRDEESYSKPGDNTTESLRNGILLPQGWDKTLPPALAESLKAVRPEDPPKDKPENTAQAVPTKPAQADMWEAALKYILLERGGPLLEATFPLYALLKMLDSPQQAEALRAACLGTSLHPVADVPGTSQPPANIRLTSREHTVTLTPDEYKALQAGLAAAKGRW